MLTVKMLKRRDGASVVVAIAVGLIVYSLLNGVVDPLARKISSVDTNMVNDWHSQYLLPLVLAVLELVALEILCWAYVLVQDSVKKK